VQSSTAPSRPMPDQSTEPSASSEPAWRFMEFFITIPWLIAWPENGFAIVSRDETLDWTPVELERLAKFLPDEVARGAIARGNHNFVAFRFRRFPIDHDSPYNRFDAVHTLAHDSMFPAAAIAFADDPIHHRRYTGRRESYETIVRAATCLINDGSGNPLKGLQDAFDHCRGPSQFGRHGGGLCHLERHPGRSSAAVGCASWESSPATTRRRSTPRPWPPGAVVIPRALAEVLQRAFSGGVGRGNRK
jgi:hypothetical protein